MIRHIHLRVRALSWEAEGILGIELVPLREGTELPPFTPGAHIDLHLPTPGRDTVRSYSLTNVSSERHRYCIAVNRDAASQGGSQWIHEHLRPGQSLRVAAPRNNFELDQSPAPAVLIAGGIGVTPLLGMVRALAAQAAPRPWQLHLAARSARHLAFADELKALAQRSNGQLHIHLDDEAGSVLDVANIVANAPAQAHLYACGPRPMLAAFESATAAAAWPAQQVHLEYFGARDTGDLNAGFTVKLQRSGKAVTVRPGQTILEAVLAEGVDALYSCRSGFCGTCEVKVLAGQPEHHDHVLSDEDKAAGQRMFICCSRSRTPVLEIDL